MAKTEQDGEVGTTVPGFTPELGSRIEELYRRVGGQGAAAELVDTISEQLGKWKRGRARMPLFAAIILCRKAGVSLDWLATGSEVAPTYGFAEDPAPIGDASQPGGAPAPLDVGLLRDVIEAVEEQLAAHGLALVPAKKALLIAELYTMILEEDAEVATFSDLITRMIRVAS